MSQSNGITESASVSEDWQLAPAEESRPLSLLLQLRRGFHGLPWIRLVHFEGGDNVVKIEFASHTVTVTGHGLTALLTAIASQRVIRLIEPSENEAKFNVRGLGAGKYDGPAIHSISVKKFGEDE